jgi:glucokinase
VRLHNDAICLAVAEHWRGAGRGVDNVLGMVVSTGVGGGLILGGRLIDGASGNAGHIGHAIVHEFEPECRCGAVGCLEAIASGPNLSAWAHAQGWREGHPLEQRTGVDLVEDARRGDRTALAAMHRAGRALGIGIATATTLCDLEVVAIGGGLSQAGPLLFDPLEASLRERTRPRLRPRGPRRARRTRPGGRARRRGRAGAARGPLLVRGLRTE